MDYDEAELRTKGSTNDEDEDVMILYVRKKPEVTQSPARLDMLLQKVPLVSTVKCTPSQLSQPCHSSRSLLRANPLIDWPEDLKGLVEDWDDLPEKQLRDTIKGMIGPLDEPLPEMVVNIHKDIEEWIETDEKKIEQIGAWLLETPSTPTPPMVVVQAEPELNGQWSSLQDQKTE